MHSIQKQETEDPILIVNCRSGEKQAFDSLTLKYQHRILKLIKMYITDDHESLDLRQEIFLKAYKGLENFRGESDFYTWLYKIATNTVKTYLIEKKRYLECSLETLNMDKFCILFKGYENLEDNINNSIELQKLSKVLNVAIKKLPLCLRNTIFLRELDELSYEEIAFIMKCPVGTVRSRIFRAKEILSKHLECSSSLEILVDNKYLKIQKSH